MQSLARRYEKASLSWRPGQQAQWGDSTGLVKSCPPTRSWYTRPSNWKESILFDLNCRWVTFYAVWMNEIFSSGFICVYFSLMIGSEASATLQNYVCGCFKKLCVWSLISLKLSHCLAISLLSYTCPSTSCTWEMYTDVKEDPKN